MAGQQRTHGRREPRAHASGCEMPDVRHFDDLIAVATEELAERGLVVPAGVLRVHARATADAVHEVRHCERVGSREHQEAVGSEMLSRRVEERTRTREMLDQLPCPDDVERATEL